MHFPTVASVLSLLLIARQVHCTEISCSECLLITREISRQLDTTAKDIPLQGPGRRIDMGITEALITEVLQHSDTCFGIGLENKAACKRLIEESEIEDRLLNVGLEGLDEYVCDTRLGLCDPHQLQSGEEL